MLFARKNGEERLIDLGSRAHGNVNSSYLGELDTIQWACKRTKALRGDVPLIIKTDSHGVHDKFCSGQVYDSDVRAFRRWAWLIANEPGFKIEFSLGADNERADLLSRPAGMNEGKSEVLRCGQMTIADMEQEVWMEHLKAHWGPYKVYHALRRLGKTVPWDVVRDVVGQCEVCCHFKTAVPRTVLRQPPCSEEPGHTVYSDCIGPLKMGRGGVRYILSFVDSATRVAMSLAIKVPTSTAVIEGCTDGLKSMAHWKFWLQTMSPIMHQKRWIIGATCTMWNRSSLRPTCTGALD